MKINRIYLNPLDPYAYRRDSLPLPEITGVYDVQPEPDLPFRICYEVTYGDGFKDYVPVHEVQIGMYEITNMRLQR